MSVKEMRACMWVFVGVAIIAGIGGDREGALSAIVLSQIWLVGTELRKGQIK
jgi:hypothetical protein